MKNLLEAVGLIILSMGGTGAIIMSVSSFLANKIATRLEQKYKLRIDKELEAYKAGLTQRSYVTKVQFDIEFELYRKLSKGMFEFIRTLYTTIEEKHYPIISGKVFQLCAGKRAPLRHGRFVLMVTVLVTTADRACDCGCVGGHDGQTHDCY